jgi:catechol 2,3-dioxygenase-like lactoylglutathione lyase family enzyme
MTDTAATASVHAPVSFGGSNPIFVVNDLAASLDYYTHQLGFSIVWQHPAFACVARGKTHLFLSVGDQGQPGAWVWIGVSDADALQIEYKASGAKIRNPPTNYAWAYEMQVEDLDGNVLRLGSDDKPDLPIGPWLDMQGQLWQHTGPNQWTLVEPAS